MLTSFHFSPILGVSCRFFNPLAPPHPHSWSTPFISCRHMWPKFLISRKRHQHIRIICPIHSPANLVFLHQTKMLLLTKALLSSVTSASLFPLPGALGVHQGYFLVSVTIVTSSAWSALLLLLGHARLLHSASAPPSPPHILHDLVNPVEGGDLQLEYNPPEGGEHPDSTPWVSRDHSMIADCWWKPKSSPAEPQRTRWGQWPCTWGWSSSLWCLSGRFSHFCQVGRSCALAVLKCCKFTAFWCISQSYITHPVWFSSDLINW